MIGSNTGAKIVWHILEISNLLNKYGDVICQQEGITTQQWLLLLYLSGDPNIPYLEREPHTQPLMASELADAFNVSRPNITNILNTLLRKDLILQLEDHVDRRKKRLALTDAGKDLLARLEPGRTSFNNKLLERFSYTERDQFLHFLETCNATIVEHFSLVTEQLEK